MAVPKWIVDSAGNWRGTSALRTNWPPGEERLHECDSPLRVRVDPLGTHAVIGCEWAYDGEQQYGTILICGSSDSNRITAAWSDSWHQSDSVMSLVGKEDGSCSVSVTGSYSVAGGPDWGWRVELTSVDDNTLVLRMLNIDPEGQEEWAVDARYSRI